MGFLYGWTPTAVVQWVLATGVVAFVLGVLFESNVRHVIEEMGWDQFLTRLIARMKPLTSRKGFWFAFGLVVGAAAIAWTLPLLAPSASKSSAADMEASNTQLESAYQTIATLRSQLSFEHQQLNACGAERAQAVSAMQQAAAAQRAAEAKKNPEGCAK